MRQKHIKVSCARDCDSAQLMCAFNSCMYEYCFNLSAGGYQVQVLRTSYEVRICVLGRQGLRYLRRRGPGRVPRDRGQHVSTIGGSEMSLNFRFNPCRLSRVYFVLSHPRRGRGYLFNATKLTCLSSSTIFPRSACKGAFAIRLVVQDSDVPTPRRSFIRPLTAPSPPCTSAAAAAA